jgi:hypothetical protein
MSPSSGSTVAGTVTIQVNATDNVGVTSVTYTLNGSLVGSSSTSPFSYSWDTTRHANGGYTLTATAWDAAGNQASSSVSVTVSNSTTDTTAPTVTITAPASGSKVSGNVEVRVSASDNLGVVKAELYVNGVLVDSSTAAPFTMYWHTKKSGSYSGWQTLTVKAYDAAGNAGTSAPVSVFVR